MDLSILTYIFQHIVDFITGTLSGTDFPFHSVFRKPDAFERV